MRKFRCSHTVEAQIWYSNPERRAEFESWFSLHGATVRTEGASLVLPSDGVEELVSAEEGEWVLYTDSEFLVMDDDSFRECYVEEFEP